MLTIRRIRYNITKSDIVKYPLIWLQHRGLRSNDVFIASYPRAGSTWLRFMLFEILFGRDPSFQAVDETIAGVGKHFNAPSILPNNGRLLQTHEPYRNEYKKAVYLVRDVRDVVVSEYYFYKRIRFYNGEFDEFFDRFLAGKVNRYGFWADHVNSWLEACTLDTQRVLLVKFEDMRQNPETTLKEILAFLNVNKDQPIIRDAIHNNSVQRMQEKENKSTKFKTNAHGLRFVNEGSIGKGPQNLSKDQLLYLEQRTGEVLRQLGYQLTGLAGE